ncbi:hypothetical protein BJV74DRAFT_990568 [Russula compacta]|nr:hypothetical protein BJV74DRAFT_990568 [Russula compacta]
MIYLEHTETGIVVDLKLSLSGGIPVLPEEFLGGSAPRPQTVFFNYIPFPAFPKLASSATHLSELSLWDIPVTGYISPEAMATCLATLPSLKLFEIGFRSPRSRPRAVLPALTRFVFNGVSEHLEGLVARIDTPKLNRLKIHLFLDLLFNNPQPHKFIARTEWTRPLNQATVTFFSSDIVLTLATPSDTVDLMIICKGPDRQASSMAHVCSQLSPLLSHVEQLDIREHPPGYARQGNGIDPTLWLELFDLFPAVEHLHIYEELRPLVARALQELIREGATEVLPTLRSLFLKGPSPSSCIREDIDALIVECQHSDHSVDVHWE